MHEKKRTPGGGSVVAVSAGGAGRALTITARGTTAATAATARTTLAALRARVCKEERGLFGKLEIWAIKFHQVDPQPRPK